MVKTGEWFSEAWQLISKDIVTHLILGLIVGLGSSITGGLLWGPLMGGYLWIVFRKLRDPEYTPEIGDVGKGFEMFVQTFLVGIVGGIIAALGILGCFVGVFVTSALVVLALPLVVEGGMDFWSAITASISKTKENLMGWILFVLAVGLVNAIGGAVGIGFIITVPLSAALMAIAYRDTFGLSGAAAGPVAPQAPAGDENVQPSEPPRPQ